MKKRIPIIAGNWKMYKTAEEAKLYIEELTPLVALSKREILIAAPFTALHAFKGSSITLGAQNMHPEPNGAYTGEISAKMLLEEGVKFVILGHSERRLLFQESNAFINQKVKAALEAGLKSILCIGETEEQREQDQIAATLELQLKECLKEVEKKDLPSLMIAYEPIWAIGTGKTATSQMANDAHLIIRNFLCTLFGEEGASVAILYGGSVKPEVMSSLMQEPHIDGVLVGGASLKPQTFSQIINFQ